MIAKPKHQRLVLVIVAATAILAAVVLAMWGLKDRAAYFYTPAEIAAGKAGFGDHRSTVLAALCSAASLPSSGGM